LINLNGINRIRFVLGFTFIFFSIFGYGQKNSVTDELKFFNYLKTNNRSEDVRILYQNQKIERYNVLQLDSLNYLVGWSLYFDKHLDSSLTYFNKISNQSVFKNSSLFYKSFISVYKGETNKARQIVNEINTSDSVDVELKNLFISTSYLLERNLVKFDSCSYAFKRKQFQLKDVEENVLDIRNEMVKNREKTPAKAAFLSALVPGLGKYYAGYFGKAISTFLPCVALAAMATESYVKAGPISPQFLITASLFSLFYVGNIYGTYYSVKIYKQEFNQRINNEILLNVHIPLRRIYN
jgi:hypothetical protein